MTCLPHPQTELHPGWGPALLQHSFSVLLLLSLSLLAENSASKAALPLLHLRLQVTAVLVEILIGEVSGFDLSALNTYRWFPHHERTNLDR